MGGAPYGATTVAGSDGSRASRVRSVWPARATKAIHAVVHWQTADGEVVTTFKTYHGTHKGRFLRVAPTGRNIYFDTVDAMRVHDGNITEHWAWRISSP